MTRAELDKNIGRKMWIRLQGGYELKGRLTKGGDKRFKGIPFMGDPSWYFMVDENGKCDSTQFRASHVKNYRFL